MTPVEACRVCGGLFPYLPRAVCAGCIDAREAIYREVREWLLENRGASVVQACAATGVEESLILSFIREGRLEFVPSEESVTRSEEDLRERIRRDMAARGGAPASPRAAGADPAPEPAAPRPARLGMRTRAS